MPNALANETSPYLLQHAGNPVDWLPWGQEAFARARELERPIFLSAGYSTCHWCHVMERESFSNPEIAALLNEGFVNIKVDREQRPDVDLTYLTYVQAATGGGGWPLSVWLTPDLKPILGGTYYPPEDKRGQPGFKRVLAEVTRVWREEREQVLERSDEITDRLQEILRSETTADPALPLLPDHDLAHFMDRVMSDVSGRFEFHHGGFSNAPKFPRMELHRMLHRLSFVIRERDPQQADWCVDMSTKTLSFMIIGGIHDQLGGGFHRYSVDTWWHVPHFEKMLFDQAQIAVGLLQAFQLTEKRTFAETATGLFNYVARDLTHPQGGFLAAEDAGSLPSADGVEKREGAVYTWDAAQVDELLGPKAGPVFRFAYGIRKDGNARKESDPNGELKGCNILFRANSPRRVADELGLPPDEVRSLLATGRKTLLEHRARRPRPHRDDKVVSAWNGLMISALALGARVLGDDALLGRARKAAGFIRENLDHPEDGLQRSWRDGVASGPAFAPDHAFIIQALLDLYETDFDIRWLQWARELQGRMDERFLDREHGGYFSVTANDPDAILSIKEDHDTAEPSVNSVAARNLFRLATLLHQESFWQQAVAVVRMARASIENMPSAAPGMIEALMWTQAPARQIVVAWEPGDRESARPLISELHKRLLPNTVLLAADGAEGQQWLAQFHPAMASMKPLAGKPSVFLCEGFECQPPATNVEDLRRLLEKATEG